MSYQRQNRLRFDRWETWAGLVACGYSAGFGSWIGSRFGHHTLGAIVGGALGGWVLQQVRHRLEPRSTP
ncbi:MAG: hypothetical protein OJF55_000377 [Rhodanobacteraceae bacterium]|jgi:hypothetical protein|nr:MAG: hypothetical protein OJF55_000377 [Rhodanobacteraceae bacterium]